MNKYLFKTDATMKPYNNKKWWIDTKIINDITVKAETIDAALKQYQNIVSENHYIIVSDNAIKNKQNMYIDTESGSQQIGYVLTAKCDFENNDNYTYSQQYIDLWVHISIIQNPFEELV